MPELAAALAALEPLEATAREVRGLADLCAGQGSNRLKMTLTSFVLAARLEEVAAAASVRLLKMTQGRYSLVHTDGGARGGARSGLGLLARDGWSGKDRDTSTLSGGETFLASLALALGLADVVTAEAGGSRIGALFVDEGFGTLDEDTLDEVMDVLDGLCDGGRIVGVVSHVAELRLRIPTQVHVTQDPSRERPRRSSAADRLAVVDLEAYRAAGLYDPTLPRADERRAAAGVPRVRGLHGRGDAARRLRGAGCSRWPVTGGSGRSSGW